MEALFYIVLLAPDAWAIPPIAITPEKVENNTL